VEVQVVGRSGLIFSLLAKSPPSLSVSGLTQSADIMPQAFPLKYRPKAGYLLPPARTTYNLCTFLPVAKLLVRVVVITGLINPDQNVLTPVVRLLVRLL